LRKFDGGEDVKKKREKNSNSIFLFDFFYLGF